jgi:sucrose phosphorylase
LKLPAGATFFNFLASHDGIGVNPLRGILTEHEIDAIVERIQSHGGLVSLKNLPDGTQQPYELNINYFDALNDPYAAEPVDTQVDRFVTAHAILLAMRGMPAVYFHSLVGSRSWREGALATGHNRTINRKKFQKAELDAVLSDPGTIPSRVFQRLKDLLKVRKEHPAFHPYGSQEVVTTAPEIFGLLRTAPNGEEQILCLHNVSNHEIRLSSFETWKFDLVKDHRLNPDTPISIKPYQSRWLVETKD